MLLKGAERRNRNQGEAVNKATEAPGFKGRCPPTLICELGPAQRRANVPAPWHTPLAQ